MDDMKPLGEAIMVQGLYMNVGDEEGPAAATNNVMVEGAYMTVAQGNAVSVEGAYLTVLNKSEPINSEEGYLTVSQGAGSKNKGGQVNMNYNATVARQDDDPVVSESMYDPRTMQGLGPEDEDDVEDPASIQTESMYDPRTMAGIEESSPMPPSRPSLTPQTAPAPTAPETATYMHGMQSRSEAEARLANNPPGTFLVRETKAVDGFVVSVATSPRTFAHVKVTRRAGSLATTDRVFDDLPELIAFYKQHSIHSGIPLTFACAR
ncbi:uncharacterized protein MONBRDRAFT_28474 [Monosiga brevicollis MX1]|uniref:SH2 domain-containing protein n=1 Tax=Monosiga brevicollis TaxID=81824 RepID=A9V8A0_MONBE|nr:uncharacterized protein MONBRDRAFT_28474 [Monosiga brevicollis MX1]EDQ86302.1 predicted protein [Monosiga brevicollis MX1]|eukprot:XP_001748972.1 hypothetical protein [Monosiga brevicollis MX1]